MVSGVTVTLCQMVSGVTVTLCQMVSGVTVTVSDGFWCYCDSVRWFLVLL